MGLKNSADTKIQARGQSNSKTHHRLKIGREALISTVNGILASDLSSENSNLPQKVAELVIAGRYMEHLRKRAAGEVMTTATWLRKFVTSHPDYKKDSRVTDEIAYDLVVACQEIGLGKRQCPELLGDFTIRELSADEAWDVVMDSSKMEVKYRNRLIQKFMQRAAGKQGREAEETEAKEEKGGEDGLLRGTAQSSLGNDALRDDENPPPATSSIMGNASPAGTAATSVW